MADTKEVLQKFGLTENEAQVYLILLRLGSATASEITQKSGIHRINVYDILERVQEKGLVSYVMIGKRKHYEAADPKKILEIEEERKKDIQSIIPELAAQRALGKAPQDATVFKDKRGIMTIFDEMTRSKTSICLFASGWGFREKFPKYYDIWHKKLVLNKVKVKSLISKKFKKKLEIPKPLEYRFLPSEYVFPSATLVYDDKVFIIMWTGHPIAILIRGKEIAASYRKFFEILWKSAK